LEYCGKRCIACGSTVGQAFEEFQEADAFDCLYQTTQLGKVIRKRWEVWSACSEISREIPQC